MQIPSRCMEEQKHIVDELNCIVKIKEQRQQELQLLDNLIKFRFCHIIIRIISTTWNCHILPINTTIPATTSATNRYTTVAAPRFISTVFQALT